MSTADAELNAGDVPEGLLASEWREIQQQIDADQRIVRHDFSTNTWYATHTNTGIEAAFDASGAVTVHGSVLDEPIATVQLAEWGALAASRAATEPAHIEVEVHRLAYHRPNLIEWYDNKPAGLMHGFTVLAPLENAAEHLYFELEVESRLDLVATADGRGAELRCPASGERRYRYDGLVAWDASGKPLAAAIHTGTATIRLRRRLGTLHGA